MALDRLDAIKIRIGIETGQTAAALAALGATPVDTTRDVVYLIEGPAEAQPFAANGVSVVLGLSGAAPHVVVQVRRVLRTRLGDEWSTFFERDGELLRIEEEQDGVRRVLTGSLSRRGGHPLVLPTTSAWPMEVGPAEALSPRQRAFLEDCSTVRLTDLPLRLLGPIRVQSWTEPVTGLEATALRWTFDDPRGEGFDAMALSYRTTPDGARVLHPVLASAMRVLGIDPDGGAAWPEERAAAYWRVC